MRSRTATWTNITRTGDFVLHVKVNIGGTDYTDITSAPVIKSDLATEPLSVGNCTSPELQFSVRTTDIISRGAEVIVYIRVESSVGLSSWKSVGTFYISQRSYKNGIYDFKCYSRLLRANQPYVADPSSAAARIGWPKTMTTVVDYICTSIGVTLDSRTLIRTGTAYMVPYPETKTMWEILGYIAGCHGGNFILTPDNTLRLVRSTYNTTGNTQITTSNHVTIPVIIGEYATGERATVSRVTMTADSDIGYTHGDDTGVELKILENPYASQQACDDIYNQVAGTTYVPFEVDSACFDPMAELGDWASIGGEVQGVIYTMVCTYGRSFRANVSAPSIYEAEDEYPYKSPVERLTENIGKRFERVMEDYTTKITQTRRAIELEASAAVSKYDTSGLSITIDYTGYGNPDDAGYDASTYEDQSVYYLDQSSGLVWTPMFGQWVTAYESPLALITDNLSSLIQQTADTINLRVTGIAGRSAVSLTTGYSGAQSAIIELAELGHTDTWTVNEDISSLVVGSAAQLRVWDTTNRRYAWVTGTITNINTANRQVTMQSTGLAGESLIAQINLEAGSATINAAKINLTGYVTITDLSKSGSTTINGDNITTGHILAEILRLYGRMSVYTDSTLTTHGGYVGYMSGQTMDGITTNGITLMSSNEQNFIIATTAGIRMNHINSSKDVALILSGGHLELRAEALEGGTASVWSGFQGNVFLNAITTYSGNTASRDYSGETHLNDLRIHGNMWLNSGKYFRLTNDDGTAGLTANYDWYKKIDDAKPRLLWTNSDPTSGFSAQSLTISGLGYYNCFIIMCRRNTSVSNEISTFCYVPYTSEMGFDMNDTVVNDSMGTTCRQRNVYITRSSNTVRFTTGWLTGGDGGGNSAILIPTHIFGMKI